MIFPGTIDNWYDQSGITAPAVDEVSNGPVILTAAAFSRGPEKITKVSGSDFFKLFGYTIDFNSYGQAAIQAANAVQNGAQLLIKRVVADDAKLANIVVTATVTSDREQKVDNQGRPLYEDSSTHEEVINDNDGQNQPVYVDIAKIKYELITVQNAKTLNDVIDGARDSFTEAETFTYPLFVIVDNGRGESSKRFGIDPQYNISKNSNYMLYKLKYLGSEDLDAESVYFALKPGIIYMNESMDIGMASSKMLQGEAASIEDSIDAFYAKIAEITGIEESTLYKYDLLFAKDNKGSAVAGITLDQESQNIGITLGMPLMSGDNGAFKDCPIETEAYEEQLNKFFGGEFDEDIYNLDMYKPDACIDANYPLSVKAKIVDLANFRKDFVFFGDLGLDVTSYSIAIDKLNTVPRSRYAAWYPISYEIINPFNRRKIKVTIGYSIARIIINQLNNRRHAPYCGIQYGWMIPEAIEGTINFTPKITPAGNQKQQMSDRRMNYASVLNDVLTLETEYTSQEAETQLSYINNVMIIQQMIKEIRTKCPSFRYSFISTNDLVNYKNQVSAILQRYANYFESLEFVYVQDDIMRANKIFEASIKVKHKDFAQSEILNIYTLATETPKEESDTGTSVIL